jgi:hypothetical protein
VLTSTPADFHWPPPWQPLPDEYDPTFPQVRCLVLGLASSGNSITAELQAELQREVCVGHLLHGRTCKAVAWSNDHSDEFLFVTDIPELPLAFVHLTWAVETHSKFPWTVGYESWEAFRSAWAEAEAF